MSQTKEQDKDEKNRVQVSKLPPKQKDLKGREAENIKGGGGAGGGVLRQRQSGEEIPQ